MRQGPIDLADAMPARRVADTLILLFPAAALAAEGGRRDSVNKARGTTTKILRE
jgi:hypothetical protein